MEGEVGEFVGGDGGCVGLVIRGLGLLLGLGCGGLFLRSLSLLILILIVILILRLRIRGRRRLLGINILQRIVRRPARLAALVQLRALVQLDGRLRRLELHFLSFLFLLFLLFQRFHVGLQIRDEAAVGTQEVGPVGPVDEVAHALVVPHVAAGGDEKRLAGRDGVEADAALGGIDARGVGVAVLALASSDACTFQQPLVRRRVEVVQALLPAAVALDADLDAAEDDLLAALEVDAELHDVAVVDGVGPALDAGARQAHVVEEGPRAGLDVLDVPLPARAPELAVPARDDLRLEADGQRVLLRLVRVALAVAADAHDGAGVLERARDGGEVQGGPRGAHLDVRDESDRRLGLFRRRRRGRAAGGFGVAQGRDGRRGAAPRHGVGALARLALDGVGVGAGEVDGLPAQPAAALDRWHPAVLAALDAGLRARAARLDGGVARFAGRADASSAEAWSLLAFGFLLWLLLCLLCLCLCLLCLCLLFGPLRRGAVQVVVRVVPQIAQAAQSAGAGGRGGCGAGSGRVQGSRGRRGGAQHSLFGGGREGARERARECQVSRAGGVSRQKQRQVQVQQSQDRSKTRGARQALGERDGWMSGVRSLAAVSSLAAAAAACEAARPGGCWLLAAGWLGGRRKRAGLRHVARHGRGRGWWID